VPPAGGADLPLEERGLSPIANTREGLDLVLLVAHNAKLCRMARIGASPPGAAAGLTLSGQCTRVTGVRSNSKSAWAGLVSQLRPWGPHGGVGFSASPADQARQGGINGGLMGAISLASALVKTNGSRSAAGD